MLGLCAVPLPSQVSQVMADQLLQYVGSATIAPLCGTRALGDERHFVFDCPHFAHIRRQFRSLYQDADGTMQCFVWHKDQKAVCHCLAAILNVADDFNKDASS